MWENHIIDLDTWLMLANPTLLHGPLWFLVLRRLHSRSLWGRLVCIHLIQPTLVIFNILKDLSIIGFHVKVHIRKLLTEGLCCDRSHVCIDGILQRMEE